MTCAADFHSAFSRGIFSLSLHTFLSSRLWKSEQEKILFHLISVTFFLLLSFYSLLWFVIIYTEYVCVEFNDYALFLPYFMKLWKSFKYYKSHKKFFLFLKSFINKLYDEVINFQNGSTKKKLSRWCSFAE